MARKKIKILSLQMAIFALTPKVTIRCGEMGSPSEPTRISKP